MALKHHPDKNPNDPEATERVSVYYCKLFFFICSGLIIQKSTNLNIALM